MINFLLC